MTSKELRKKFFNFFEKRGHKIVPSSSLIPDDPSVLLTTAGMQQFKAYLTGVADPMKAFGSKSVCSIQKCFRTTDIDEVGDFSHLTMFEMTGNFSFGDYFKEKAIPMSFEFLTSEEGLGLDPQRLYVTCFKGDADVDCDEEAIKIWQEQFAKAGIDAKVGERIFLYGREKNWWEAGPGPCGPDAEMFYETGKAHDKKFGETCHPNCDCGHFMEIGNDVFVQYNKTKEGTYEPITQRSIDNGRGFERLAMVTQGKDNVFETDLFSPIVDQIKEVSHVLDQKVIRILADHLRSSIFLIADGIRPSNKEAGYILRRLLRRVLAYSSKYDIHADLFPLVLERVVENFGEAYPELNNKKEIVNVYYEERDKFNKAIGEGLKAFNILISAAKETDSFIAQLQKMIGLKKHGPISGKDSFSLYETYGFPKELMQEFCREKDIVFDEIGFDEEYKKHQATSRAGAEKKFGGHGLVLDTGELKAGSKEDMEKVIKLHTATHLLQKALRNNLGDEIKQMGSDINPERGRFDFSFTRKLTEEEVKKVESEINDVINSDLPVYFKEMLIEEAKKTGALFFFKEKYPNNVKVYFIGPKGGGNEKSYSVEFCGGPHVEHTLQIGSFKIQKQESVGAGTRRIKFIVGN
ncbi:MAG: alanine--tRNA ligase [Patescibacteria group bacterium]